MADSEIDKAFLGVGWCFPPEFHKYADNMGVRMVAEEEDIRESLMILLSTRPGERVMQPAYGCGLHAMVFETLSESTITEIRDVIERAVLFYEPRIILESVDVNTEDVYDGKLLIRLNYIVRRTNSRSNVVYPFYHIEGSLVRV
jgi:phage baseplate assembly protein W